MRFVRIDTTLVRSTSAGATSKEARDTAKRLAAEVFARALAQAGASHAAVGDLVGVSDVQVGKMADGAKHAAVVPSIVEALLCQPAVWTALRAEIEAERLRLWGPPLGPDSPEGELMAAMESLHEFGADGTRSMRDGRLDATEKERQVQRAQESIARLQRFVARARGGGQ